MRAHTRANTPVPNLVEMPQRPPLRIPGSVRGVSDACAVARISRKRQGSMPRLPALLSQQHTLRCNVQSARGTGIVSLPQRQVAVDGKVDGAIDGKVDGAMDGIPRGNTRINQ